MLNMGDSSTVQMPQMIQPPPISGRVPSADKKADSTPEIQPPQRTTTRTIVRLPLAVRIVPEASRTKPAPARRRNRLTASKRSR